MFGDLFDALLGADEVEEAGEEVVAVMRAGAGLGVVLHREDRLAFNLQAGVGTVEERDVGLLDVLRQALGVDGEAVVHRGDLDLAGGEVLHRMIGTVVALVHLLRLAADGEAEKLVAETDAEHRLAGFHQRLDGRDGVLARGGRVARAVREEDAVGVVAQHILGCRGGRYDGDARALFGELAQDVALGAEIDGDDVEVRLLELAVAFGAAPRGLVPVVGLRRSHFLGEVEALEAGEGLELSDHRRLVEMARWIMRDDAVRHAVLADAGGQSAGVDTGDADDVALLEPSIEPLDGAIVRRVGDVGPEHGTADTRKSGHVDRLDILVVGAHIADVREGERDDLSGVGGIGEDLLVAGHCGVEADLAGGVADCTDAVAFESRAVTEDQEGGRGLLLPAGHGGAPRFFLVARSNRKSLATFPAHAPRVRVDVG